MKPRISPDRIKLFGWAVILIFCLAGVFVLRETPPGKAGLAILTFVLALLAIVAVIVSVFLIRARLRKLWRRRFPPRPLWAHPREASTLYDSELTDALLARLDLVQRDDRASLWRDRETGQLWAAFAWDFEFTENTVLTPIARREDWRGMAAGARD